MQMGMNMMKFVANHRYRFSSPSLAFFTGILVTSIHMMLELLTFLVLTISTDTLQIVINFMGLVAISEFEDYVAHSVNIDNYKSILLGEEFKKFCFTIVVSIASCPSSSEFANPSTNGSTLKLPAFSQAVELQSLAA
jgi:hypothetical protein